MKKYIIILLISVLCLSVQHKTVLYPFTGKFEIAVKINESQIPDALGTWTGYPMYINLSSLPANFWTNVKAAGVDIRMFSGAYPDTTQIPMHLIEFVDNGSTGTGTLFCKTDLDADLDTYVYLRYGNPNLTSLPAAGAYNGQYAVWTSLYQGWDTKETAHSTSVPSLNNGLTFTTDGSSTKAAITGKMEKAAVQTTTIWGRKSVAINYLSAMTVTSWVKSSDVGAALGTFVLTASGDNVWNFKLRQGGTSSLIGTKTTVNDNATTSSVIYDSSDDGIWTHMAFSNSSGTVKMYKNGSSVSLSDNATHASITSATLEYWIAFTNGVDLGIDMLLIWNSTISDEGITTTYNNQNAPNTFKTIGNVKSIWKAQIIN